MVIYLVIWWDIFGKVGCFWVMFFWKIWRIAFCQLPFDGERKKLFSVQQIQYKWLSVFNANVLVQSKLLELQGLASWKLHKIEVSWCVFTWNLSSIVFSWNAPWPGHDWQWSYSHLHPADDGHYIVYLLSLCCGANHEEWCYEGDLGMNFRSCESFPRNRLRRKVVILRTSHVFFHPSNVHFQEKLPFNNRYNQQKLMHSKKQHTHTKSKVQPFIFENTPFTAATRCQWNGGKTTRQDHELVLQYFPTVPEVRRSEIRRKQLRFRTVPVEKIDTNQTCGILS